MTYVVKWQPKAVEELRKLPPEIAARIVKRIDLAKESPKHFLERLTDDPGYKIRSGDYRVIVDLMENDKIIAIRVVGHRKNIYKKWL